MIELKIPSSILDICEMMDDDEFPDELEDVFKAMNSSVEGVDKVIKPLIETERSELIREMEPLDVAKLDLVTAYAVNSMFWGYLLCNGVNPKSHPVKQELERIRNYMGKVKEIEDRKNAPRLMKDAARRFVRHAMFDHKDSPDKPSDKVEEEDEEEEKSSDVEDHVANKADNKQTSADSKSYKKNIKRSSLTKKGNKKKKKRKLEKST